MTQSWKNGVSDRKVNKQTERQTDRSTDKKTYRHMDITEFKTLH